MTRNSDSTVSLSWSNWAGVLVTIVISIAGNWFLLNARVTTLEANYANQQHQLDGLSQSRQTDRTEILNEIHLLRQDINRQR